jgi:hypothetical protein
MNTRRVYGRPFQPGNPGKPKGARHKTTLIAEKLAIEKLMEDDAEGVARRVIGAAKDGDMTAARLVLERIYPVRKGRPVHLDLPEIERVADLPVALSALLSAMGHGEITPEEAAVVANVIEAKRRTLETVELEQRIAVLEEAKAAGGK